MSRNRGVNPNETTQLPLSDGDWIEVRMRLSSGEERMIQRLTAKGYQRADSDGGDSQIRVDLDVTKFASNPSHCRRTSVWRSAPRSSKASTKTRCVRSMTPSPLT
jgi:hypothetical protein